MSKLTLQIGTLNVYLGGGEANSSVGIDALLGALVAGAAVSVDHQTRADESECADKSEHSDGGCVAVEATDWVGPTYAETLRGAMVMTTNITANSSTRLELTETRKQGNAVAVAGLHDQDYAVVQAASAEGEALHALGLIATTGYVNKYYKSGNFGRTIHATMDKADEYSDGDCVAVEVYVAYAGNFQNA